MRPHVTALVLGRGGPEYLSRTLDRLAAQRRRPDSVVVGILGQFGADAAPTAALPATFVSLPRRVDLNEAVHRSLAELGPAVPAQWIWLLGEENAPAPGALEALLSLVERSPSVLVAGPKLVHGDDPALLARFGVTMTSTGVAVAVAADELDQGQHDTLSDALAVDLGGMLVRRDLWERLGGIDPALETTDAGLDFGIRARRAGVRVSLVPDAVVASHPQGIRLGSSHQDRPLSVRSAQLHRRLAYAPGWAVPLHWLLLLPTALVRAIGQLLAKRPGRIPGEFIAALGTVVALGAVSASRRRMAATSRLPWSAIASLRRSPEESRHLRQVRREQQRAIARGSAEAPPFFTGGGLLAVIVAAVVGVVAFGSLLGAAAVVGGGLLPLGDLGDLWRAAGFAGVRVDGLPADPFHTVLAVLGSFAPWAPAIVMGAFYLVALPVAATGAWFLAVRLTPSAGMRVASAILWAVAPTFLSSLGEGRLGAAIAHLALPFLVSAALAAPRSWSASGAAALLLAAVAGSAPSLLPALAVLYVVLLVMNARALHRLLLIALPSVALSIPLVLWQLGRLAPLDLAADPGVPLASAAAPAWQLALGFPEQGLGGWLAWAGSDTLTVLITCAVVAALTAPLGVTAALGLFRRTQIGAALLLGVAALGLVTAVGASRIAVVSEGTASVGLWPGAGLSLYWLGLIGAMLVAAPRARGLVRPVLTSLAAIAAAAPLLAAPLLGTAAVRADAGVMPAIVAAEAIGDPQVGTLVLTPQQDGGLAVEVVRGDGGELQDASTARSTADTVDQALAPLVADLIAGNGSVASVALPERRIGFVLLAEGDGGPLGTGYGTADASEESDDVHRRALVALDANVLVARVSETEHGVLWRVTEFPAPTGEDAVEVVPFSPLDWMILVGQLTILVGAAILAVPSRRVDPLTARDARAVSGNAAESQGGPRG